MSKLVCIVCPRGCTMEVTESGGEYTVTGNFCKRGRDFAIADDTDEDYLLDRRHRIPRGARAPRAGQLGYPEKQDIRRDERDK